MMPSAILSAMETQLQDGGRIALYKPEYDTLISLYVKTRSKLLKPNGFRAGRTVWGDQWVWRDESAQEFINRTREAIVRQVAQELTK